ncbi:DUF3718 domain-containing protein [Rheinheimera sp. MMS21-TC3]|uniref:DUF3718 domain-containing protein n=1 Tax=Rheinheimera sp. MMS21-TC3 TaxID=3072790 RepID=UPI0028C4A088|nr:DUF3718 domain-containing protein [Rheinheimera sp. MMS21-TC3]WNO61277.1 DUF3718 domain-containing protein [Rheinheimera sp. MMS21-TC3]
MNFKFAALTAAFVASSFVSTPVLANDQLAFSICSYVAADNKNSLRKTLSDNRLRLRTVYEGIVCDGLPLVRHAIKNNAVDTASFMISQLPSSSVAAAGDVEWAQSNGFAASAIIDVIKERSSS